MRSALRGIDPEILEPIPTPVKSIALKLECVPRHVKSIQKFWNASRVTRNGFHGTSDAFHVARNRSRILGRHPEVSEIDAGRRAFRPKALQSSSSPSRFLPNASLSPRLTRKRCRVPALRHTLHCSFATPRLPGTTTSGPSGLESEELLPGTAASRPPSPHARAGVGLAATPRSMKVCAGETPAVPGAPTHQETLWPDTPAGIGGWHPSPSSPSLTPPGPPASPAAARRSWRGRACDRRAGWPSGSRPASPRRCWERRSGGCGRRGGTSSTGPGP